MWQNPLTTFITPPYYFFEESVGGGRVKVMVMDVANNGVYSQWMYIVS